MRLTTPATAVTHTRTFRRDPNSEEGPPVSYGRESPGAVGA